MFPCDDEPPPHGVSADESPSDGERERILLLGARIEELASQIEVASIPLVLHFQGALTEFRRLSDAVARAFNSASESVQEAVAPRWQFVLSTLKQRERDAASQLAELHEDLTRGRDALERGDIREAKRSLEHAEQRFGDVPPRSDPTYVRLERDVARVDADIRNAEQRVAEVEALALRWRRVWFGPWLRLRRTHWSNSIAGAVQALLSLPKCLAAELSERLRVAEFRLRQAGLRARIAQAMAAFLCGLLILFACFPAAWLERWHEGTTARRAEVALQAGDYASALAAWNDRLADARESDDAGTISRIEMAIASVHARWDAADFDDADRRASEALGHRDFAGAIAAWQQYSMRKTGAARREHVAEVVAQLEDDSDRAAFEATRLAAERASERQEFETAIKAWQTYLDKARANPERLDFARCAIAHARVDWQRHEFETTARTATAAAAAGDFERARAIWHDHATRHAGTIDAVAISTAARDIDRRWQRASYDAARRVAWKCERDGDLGGAAAAWKRYLEQSTAHFDRAREQATRAAVEAELELLDAGFHSWGYCCASIADVARCPAYAGLQLGRQPGLDALGRNPRTKLWEFLVDSTGENPKTAPNAAQAGIVLVLLPGGSFLEGAQSRDPGEPHYDVCARLDEGPVESHTLQPLFFGKYEITQAQWFHMTGSRPSGFACGTIIAEQMIADTHPVERVSWDEATQVLARYRLELPSERAWEFALRANRIDCDLEDANGRDWRIDFGLDVDYLEGATNRIGDSPLAIDADHRIAVDGYVSHAPVYRSTRHPWGLHDLIGNVSEWCRDPYRPDRSRDASILEDRVIRGGDFFEPKTGLRATRRTCAPRSARLNRVGLRACRPVQ